MGRVQLVVEPLFPYYLFILLDGNTNWSSIRSTRGVSKIVHFNGVPASLAHPLVEALQSHCAKLNGCGPEPIYKAGDRVLITDGCFKSLEAIVTATDGEERVILLLNFLNRPQQVGLSISAVVGL